MAYRALSFRRAYRWLARLAAREPHRIVGTAKDPWDCPLCTYLRTRNPHTAPYVNAYAYSLYPPGAPDDPTQPDPVTFGTLAEWAEYFVGQIDDLAPQQAPGPGAGGHHQHVPITAAQALEILRHWKRLQRLNHGPTKQPNGARQRQTKEDKP